MNCQILRIVLIIAISSPVANSNIELKKKFFSGWNYSVDGQKFKKVGMSGNYLRDHMTGNEYSVMKMNKYKTNKTWATITAWPGGFLIGWPIGGYLASGEWDDNYSTMIYIGAPLAIVSLFLEASSTRNLKEAVKTFNESEAKLSISIWQLQRLSDNSNTTTLGLSFRF